MRNKLIVLCTAILLQQIPCATFAQYPGTPAEQAAKAREEEAAKAAAHKARDDAEVQRQAKQQEIEKAKRRQKACKRARTC